jgi:hypothetical protein
MRNKRLAFSEIGYTAEGDAGRRESDSIEQGASPPLPFGRREGWQFRIQIQQRIKTHCENDMPSDEWSDITIVSESKLRPPDRATIYQDPCRGSRAFALCDGSRAFYAVDWWVRNRTGPRLTMWIGPNESVSFRCKGRGPLGAGQHIAETSLCSTILRGFLTLIADEC